MSEQKFPPRIRGYYDGDPYYFCNEQWEILPSKYEKTHLEHDFLTLEEHSAIVDELKAENERLRAFISKAHNSSTCPATVLVAGQVLNGHDVRSNHDTKDAEN